MLTNTKLQARLAKNYAENLSILPTYLPFLYIHSIDFFLFKSTALPINAAFHQLLAFPVTHQNKQQ